MATSNSRVFVLLLMSSLFFLAGILFDFMPVIVESQIKRTIEVAENQEIQSIWARPPVDIHSYFWLFEVLNADAFVGGEKVQIRKIGPYHFTSRLRKKIIEVSTNKLRITYNSSRIYSLNRSNPTNVHADFDRPISLVNPVYSALVAGTRQASQQVADPQTRLMISASANRLAEYFNETLFLNTTAAEALLGRRLPMLEKVRKLIETFELKLNLPANLMPEGQLFGYVAMLNNTASGPFEIYSGYQASQDSLGDLISHQGKRRLTEYRGKCNRLQASAGELRPMPLNPEQNLEMFQPNFCRIVHLEPTGLRKLREGLAIAYRIAPKDLASAHKNPDNSCFCQNQTKEDFCSLDGTFELGPCTFGVPLVLSLHGVPLDETITSSISNWDNELLEPSLELLERPDPNSQLLLLKRLGIPARIDLTATLFMKVIRDSAFKQTQSVPEVSYLPLVTVREIVNIPPTLSQIVYNLESFLVLSNHIKVIMYLSSLVLLVWLVSHQYKTMSRDRIRPMAGASSVSSQLPLAGTECAAELPEIELAYSGQSEPASRPIMLEVEAAVEARAGTESSEQQTGVQGSAKKSDTSQSSSPNANSPVVTNEPAKEEAEQAGPDGSSHKSWLVKVCSNLVRLLTGLRSSLNEAGQLGVSENSYQDKQLEMLAGKIDNWYNKSASLVQPEKVWPSSSLSGDLHEQAEQANLEEDAGAQSVKQEGQESRNQVDRSASADQVLSVRQSANSSQTTVINRSDSIAGSSTADASQPEDKADALDRAESALRQADDIGHQAGSNIPSRGKLDQSGAIDESLLAETGSPSSSDRFQGGADSKLAGKRSAKRLLATTNPSADCNEEPDDKVAPVGRLRTAAKLDSPNRISADQEQTEKEVAPVSANSRDDGHQGRSQDTSRTEVDKVGLAGDKAAQFASPATLEANPSSTRSRLQIKQPTNSRTLNGAIASTGNNNISNGKIMPARQALDSEH